MADCVQMGGGLVVDKAATRERIREREKKNNERAKMKMEMKK